MISHNYKFVYLVAFLLFFVIIFHNVVIPKKNEDIRRKELRMKYYL
jgi:hypothetical protein